MADVLAHITGTVWKIEAKAGAQVSEGDTVVILESMKMEMPVEDKRLAYKTSMDGVYLCGACTHPGGGVVAINGRNAAMAILGL